MSRFQPTIVRSCHVRLAYWATISGSNTCQIVPLKYIFTFLCKNHCITTDFYLLIVGTSQKYCPSALDAVCWSSLSTCSNFTVLLSKTLQCQLTCSYISCEYKLTTKLLLSIIGALCYLKYMWQGILNFVLVAD